MIQPGDKVSWQQRTVTRPYIHTMLGTVDRISDDFAIIEVGTWHPACIHVSLLTKLGAIEQHVDDYAFAVAQAGSLGGVELD